LYVSCFGLLASLFYITVLSLLSCTFMQSINLINQSITKLHSVQNAAARFMSKSGKFDHITPILRYLHWLPIRRRVDFKVATLIVSMVSRHPISSMTAYQYPCCLVGSTYGLQTRASWSSRKQRVVIFRRFWTQLVQLVQQNCERLRVLLLFAGN